MGKDPPYLVSFTAVSLPELSNKVGQTSVQQEVGVADHKLTVVHTFEILKVGPDNFPRCKVFRMTLEEGKQQRVVKSTEVEHMTKGKREKNPNTITYPAPL